MVPSIARPLASRMPQRRSPEAQPALGKAIRQIREREEFSQEELAERANLHPTWISPIERGHNNPNWGTVRRIARGLGVTMVELVALAERLE